MPQPTIHRILTGESTEPRLSTLKPLADYFGVSVSELRGEGVLEMDAPYYYPAAKEAGAGYSRDEEILIEKYRNLSPEDRARLHAISDALDAKTAPMKKKKTPKR